MRYALRINYFEAEQGPLMLGAVRPAVAAVRASFPGASVALRCHWLRGRHVLLDIDGLGAADGEAAYALAAGIVSAWMAACPSRGIGDAERFAAASRILAGVEGVAGDALPLRRDNSVEAADYRVPDFMDDPGLSAARDRFVAATLDLLFEVIDRRTTSGVAALGLLLRRMLFIEHLADRPGFARWLASPLGQVEETAKRAPAAMEGFARNLALMLPLLAEEGLPGRALDRGSALSDAERRWVELLRRSHADVRDRVDRLDADALAALGDPRRDGAAGGPGAAPDMARARAYVGYRAFMNMFYLLFQLAGFTMTTRWLGCYVLAGAVRAFAPDVAERAGGGSPGLARVQSPA